MRISCDTNMIVAAVYRPDGGSRRALKYISDNKTVLLCIPDYVREEALGIVRRKMPDKEHIFVELFRHLNYQEIKTIDRRYESSVRISDPKDQPIMDIIAANDIDVYISNDRHFLEHAHELDRPEIMSLHDFEFKYFSKICNRPLEVMMKRKDERKRSSEGKAGNYLVFDGAKTGRPANPQHPFVPRLIRMASVRRVPRNGKMIIAVLAK